MCNFLIERSLFQTSAEVKISRGLVEINIISSDIQQVIAIGLEYDKLDIERIEPISIINN